MWLHPSPPKGPQLREDRVDDACGVFRLPKFVRSFAVDPTFLPRTKKTPEGRMQKRIIARRFLLDKAYAVDPKQARVSGRSQVEHSVVQVLVAPSLMVVELAILTNEEDASLSRDALGYVPLAALLEEVGASWQGDIRVVRLLIDHGP